MTERANDRPVTILLFAVGATLGATGCLNVGVYRTARSLPEGEGDLSLTWSYVRATVAARDVTTVDGEEVVADGESEATFGYPNVVPEIAYHHGVLDDLELGGRLAPTAGFGELDAKYRFYGSNAERMHLAVQPTLGYRGLGFINGVHTSLPLIATFDVARAVSLNAAVFGMFTSYDASVENAQDELDFGGDSLVGGASVGVQLRSSSGFHFMPALELQRTLARSGDVESLPDISSVIFAITMGWGAKEQ